VLLVPYLRGRRRRRDADGAALVAAAWREAMLRLRPVGIGELATLTTREVAVLGTARLGAGAQRHLDPLARLADAAAFAPAPLDRSDGLAAWRHVDGLTPVVRGALSRGELIRDRLHPRSLRG
jgi:hypothetical protein